MKNYIVLFVTLFILQLCVPARAAFIVKVNSTDTTVVAVKLPVAAAQPVQEKKSGWAGIASIICSALGLIFGIAGWPFILWLPGIIFGIVGVGKNRKNQALAAVGIVLGVIALIVTFLVA